MFSTHTFYGRTSKPPIVVRAYTLKTYVHIPLGRTTTRLRTYVLRTRLGKIGICVPELPDFWRSENRIFGPVGKPRLILSHSQRRCKNQNKRKGNNNAPLCQSQKQMYLAEKIYCLALRRYTSSRREYILIWKVSNTLWHIFHAMWLWLNLLHSLFVYLLFHFTPPVMSS